MQSRFFQTADGLRLHYLSHPCDDADSKSYCLLLHGFTNDAHVWDVMAAQLQASHHVLALDHRGHGDSDWDPAARYSHWQLADDLRDFLQQDFLQQPGVVVHVVGHSLGARIALLALEQELKRTPCSICSLTLIDAGPEVSADAGERLVHDVRQLPESYPDVRAWRDSLARIYVMADPAMLANLVNYGLRVRGGQLRGKTDPAFTPGIWHKTPELQQLHRERGTLSEQLWQALRSLQLPVHLLRGQASSIVDSGLAARMLHELGEHAELSVVSRAGHAVMVDNPAACNVLVARFINTRAAAAALQEAG